MPPCQDWLFWFLFFFAVQYKRFLSLRLLIYKMTPYIQKPYVIFMPEEFWDLYSARTEKSMFGLKQCRIMKCCLDQLSSQDSRSLTTQFQASY